VTFLFVLRLEPDDNNEGQLESFATEPLNLKHHAAYIRLALQMEDGGEIATHAQSQMVNAVPATNGKSSVY